ncbi:PPC domain-containing protein [Oscillatoria sp. HE19RPO]|uniref:PPC domain-containing protein n=1 Tax=Oscillatoria sp. HE19RPO TaxID=2954806 RepID=UPI0020C513DB|nr:PPC domain-containing protein [Oscillatoria sp. HE19RPO]
MTVNLFNPSFYSFSNPDLAAAGLTSNEQLLAHFQSVGIEEGRQFSPLVNLNSIYRQQNSDLAAAGLTNNRELLNHLQTFGVAEGRDFSAVFDANFYRENNADLQAAGLNNEQLLEHFRTFGISEGRAASANFDVNFYLTSNFDLQAAGFNNEQALFHFVTSGLAEGRRGSAFGVPSNNLNTAVDLGNLTGTQGVSDFVGNADPSDIYRFVLGTPSNLRVNLTGLSADADVDLIRDFNANGAIDFGDIIEASLNGGATPEAIATDNLAAGTYFVRVFQAENMESETNYNLNLSLA